MNDKRFTLKTRFDEQQELEQLREDYKRRAEQSAKFKKFGFNDFFFFFIVIIISLLCKILGVDFQ